jgi:hypothetical protein
MLGESFRCGVKNVTDEGFATVKTVGASSHLRGRPLTALFPLQFTDAQISQRFLTGRSNNLKNYCQYLLLSSEMSRDSSLFKRGSVINAGCTSGNAIVEATFGLETDS